MGYSVYGARMTIEPTTRSIITSFVFSFLCILFAKYIKKEKYSKLDNGKGIDNYYKNIDTATGTVVGGPIGI